MSKRLPTINALSWQEEMMQIIRDPGELFERLQLPQSLLPAARAACELFPLKVPHPYLRRMRPGDLDDPLLRQVLPLSAELDPQPGFTHDPLQEFESAEDPSVLNKYEGRTLVITSPNCAIHCRYCFRRNFPYSDNRISRADWQRIFTELTQRPDIEEVILSGGDPLSLSDRQLAWIMSQLAAISHIRRVRLHTRLPVTIPARLCAEAEDWLTSTRLQVIVVLHINHAQEIDAELASTLARMQQLGILLLNQAVLLRGINDSLPAQTALSDALINAKVIPYYLHVLDKVSGAAHFLIDDDTALQLHHQMLSTMSGYMVPRLVRENPGATSKTPLF